MILANCGACKGPFSADFELYRGGVDGQTWTVFKPGVQLSFDA